MKTQTQNRLKWAAGLVMGLGLLASVANAQPGWGPQDGAWGPGGMQGQGPGMRGQGPGRMQGPGGMRGQGMRGQRPDMARGLVFLAALRRLDLTEEQREQVRAKVEAFRERMTDTERPAPEQGEELRDLLTGDEVDRHAIRRLVDEEAEQRFQHLVAIAELSAEVRGVLTEEQREQLDTMRERGAGRGMRTPQGRRGRGLAPQGFGPGTGPGREPGQGMGQGMGPQAGPGRGPQGPRAAAPGPDLW